VSAGEQGERIEETRYIHTARMRRKAAACQRIAPQFRIVMMRVLRAITTTDVNLR